MDFSSHNSSNHSHHIEMNFFVKLQQDLIDDRKQIKPQTPFSILNQTLQNLNNDLLHRYNTDVNQSPTQILQFSQVSLKPIRHNHRQFYPTFDQVLIPEPWYNLDSPLTQIRQKHNKFNNLSKSFHLSKSVNNNSRNYHFNHSSISSNKDHGNKSFYGKSEKWKQKLNTFLTEESENFAETFATYNYTNQQKARMTLEHLVHKKKHSKMQKILKLKTHSFDSTLQKQQKLTSQSKHLIDALQKFSNDNMLRKSIDRAVDVLKKRTHSLSYNKSISRQNFPKTVIDETSVKWFSCHKIGINSINDDCKEERKMKRDERSLKCMISPQLKADMLRAEKEMNIKHKCKISFKPKRNYIIEGRKQKSDKKQKEPTQFYSNIANFPTSKKFSTKPKMSINKLIF